jgi:hypothetical protein
MTSTNKPSDTEGETFRRGRSRCLPGYAGQSAHPAPHSETDMRIKTEVGTISNRPSACLND